MASPATTRLTFLYPHLFRAARASDSATASGLCNASGRRSRRAAADVTRVRRATLATTTNRWQPGFAKRHGTAVEPQPQQQSPLDPMPAEAQPEDGEGEDMASDSKPAAATAPSKTISPDIPVVDEVFAAAAAAAAATAPESKKTDAPAEASESAPEPAVIELGPPQDVSTDGAVREGSKKHASGPMETILGASPPDQTSDRPPALAPPPYVHHFDSYSLVKQLEGGGWTQAQAITAMKAVRGLLAQNLDAAQAGLVGKSDVENETYLFKAACSELSTEVRNGRRLADEETRQQRTLLQHEVDILAQSFNQEVLTLNDSVRGMFNDRKMAVREEQKTVDSAIQQIAYKISVELNSDARSEIEGLRWVLIRRSVLGIVFMALLTLGTLRYASYLSHERKKEAERAAREAREAEQTRKNEIGRRDHTTAPDAAEILAAN